MSLVGNLEDLSLGDILQIISLSQKFGVLALESDRGSGRIVFSSGLVRGACLKGVDGHFDDLRSLIVGKGILDPAGFDACEARANDLGLSIEEMLRSEASLDVARIDALIEEAVQAAVLEMFKWPSGDFSFDVRSEPDAADPQLILRTGINSQYLAMEGMRVRDESQRAAKAAAASGKEAVDGPTVDDLSTAEMFGLTPVEPLDDFGEPDIEPGDHELDAEFAIGKSSSEAPFVDAESLAQTETTAPDVVVGAALASADAPAAPPAAAASHRPAGAVHARPLILIDPDVVVLEWVKAALQDSFRQVHVFQQAEQGLMRIRQYLIRGELPVVLISPEAEVDPLSGITGLSDFVKRLKAQAGRLPVYALVEAEAPPAAGPQGVFDAVLARPDRKQLRDAQSEGAGSPGQALAADLATCIGA